MNDANSGLAPGKIRATRPGRPRHAVNSGTGLFEELASSGTPVVIDGGLATQVEAQGHDISTALWSAALLRSNPRAIVDAHRAFLDAGAKIVISASYQASRGGFAELDVAAGEADRLIASSVALARRACREFAADRPDAGPRLVAASVGPYGAVLHDGSEYTGHYGVATRVLERFHAPRLQVLEGAEPDLLACETIPSGDEALVLAELLAGVETPAWVTFSCRDGTSISDGTPIREVAAVFAEHPTVLALGVNCTPPRHVTSLIQELRTAVPGKPVVVYPNSGERYDAETQSWFGTSSADEFAGVAAEWAEAGASLIGGCCRVGPSHIRAIVDRIHG